MGQWWSPSRRRLWQQAERRSDPRSARMRPTGSKAEMNQICRRRTVDRERRADASSEGTGATEIAHQLQYCPPTVYKILKTKRLVIRLFLVSGLSRDHVPCVAGRSSRQTRFAAYTLLQLDSSLATDDPGTAQPSPYYPPDPVRKSNSTPCRLQLRCTTSPAKPSGKWQKPRVS